MAKQSKVGLTVKKEENFSEWYTQVIQKAELVEYTDVSGCMIVRPTAWAIWENVQSFLNKKLKQSGVQNAAFPLFIPERNLTREKEHVEGFTPEVAWVTHAGESELAEKLAVRPTSETIMYPAYAKWIRSHKDLPLRLNQWCSVIRWEFKHPVPFLRTREFWWQEGHTVFASKEEADAEAHEILEYYREVFEDLYAIPVIKGKKTEKEKFAGALYTLSVESFMPNGKAIQGATSHCLGQNFAKAFNISYQGEDENQHTPWQNSWGLTTRTIGMMIMMHGDDKGLVMPPNIAPIPIVIVPILFSDSKNVVLEKARAIKKDLSKKYNVSLDEREDYSSGWKFNEWELKGVPLRIELGPRDLDSNTAMLVRRDTGEKRSVQLPELKSEVKKTLRSIQKDMLKRAKTFIKRSTVLVKGWRKFKEATTEKKLIKAAWCESTECEENIKHESGGVKILNIPFKQGKIREGATCVKCRQPAKVTALFAKSY